MQKAIDHILDKPGYDAASGLYFAPIGKPVPVPEKPSQEQIHEAKELLKFPLLDFPFASPGEGIDAKTGRAIAIYGMMIATNRPVLPTAPGFAFTSHGEGMSSGKTLLAALLTTIATGRLPVPVALSPEFGEQDKQLTTYLLEGDGSLFLDNIANGTRFDSTALAKIMTSERYRGRLLGANKRIEVSTRTFITATGNSLNLAGDLASRFLLICLDTGLERPQDRSNSNFKIPNLIPWAIEHRQEIVAAVHTIVRAYLQECRRRGGTPSEVEERKRVPGTRACGQCDVLERLFSGRFLSCWIPSLALSPALPPLRRAKIKLKCSIYSIGTWQ